MFNTHNKKMILVNSKTNETATFEVKYNSFKFSYKKLVNNETFTNNTFNKFEKFVNSNKHLLKAMVLSYMYDVINVSFTTGKGGKVTFELDL